MPFRLEIKGECVLPRETLLHNAEVNSRHPFIETKWASNGRKLAVVGGGPLVRNDLPELQVWDGDVWAINYTAEWLNNHGVKATLFSVDPEPFISAAPSAILGSVCDPSVFAAFEGRVQTFHMLQTHADGIGGGSCSASCAAAVALRMGYTNVSFFGVEGSFDGQDHIDRHEGRPHQVVIRAGGVDYVTFPPFMIQCEELAKLFVFDGVFHNRSGGLLKAMIDHPDTWEVVAVSPAMKQHLEEINGRHGLYEAAYVPQGKAA